MTRILLGGLMFLVGTLAAFQPPVNAALARRTGSVGASVVSFAVGTVVLVLLALLLGELGGLAGVRGAPAWTLTGGLIGAVFVLATVLLVPRLGAGGLVAAAVAGQLTGAVLIDRFGLFGLPQVGLTPLRVLGLVLLSVGGALVVIQR